MHFIKYLRINALFKTFRKNANIFCSCRFYNVLSDDIPIVSVSTIKRVLNSHKFQFEEGHTCLITNCPLCNKHKTTAKIYINKTTGFFSCHSCNYSGSWNILEKYFNIKNEQNLKHLLKYSFTKDNDEYKRIISNSKLLNKFSDDFIKTICNNFSLPNVPLPILNLLNIRFNESENKLYVPLLDVEGNTSGFRTFHILKDNENNDLIDERTVPITDCNGILIAKSSRTRDNCATIVTSLKDALVLLDAKITGSVVCLPYNLSVLPLNVLPTLERFNKLVLWFGNGVSSWDTARSFAKKLGEKRCFFVRPTDKQPLPYIASQQGADLKAIVSSAQPVWHKSITTFASLRQDVLSDLQNIDRVQGVKWKRFPILSKILKGHRRGELTVITGPTGCGKTTFISEYSLDLALQGVNTLWGSFEIRNARLARTMLQQMAGCALDENLDKFDDWADQFERLPVYFMTFHGQQSIKVVMEAVEHATYVHDIVHVIIDNVQFMMGLSESESRHMDRFWKQDSVVAAFRMFATRRNCHVTLVIHPRKERDAEELTTSSIFGGAKASQEADNVLIIQDKRLTSLRGKKYLQVAKNRYSGDLGIMPMEFDKAALSYMQKKKKLQVDSGQLQQSDDTTIPPKHL